MAVHPFGERLRALRMSRSISMRDLEARSGIQSGTLSRLEKGEFRPRPDNVQRLAHALHVPHADLMVAAGYPAQQLPLLRPYLRAAFGMREDDAADVERYIQRKYGASTGPRDGEDELEDETEEERQR